MFISSLYELKIRNCCLKVRIPPNDHKANMKHLFEHSYFNSLALCIIHILDICSSLLLKNTRMPIRTSKHVLVCFKCFPSWPKSRWETQSASNVLCQKMHRKFSTSFYELQKFEVSQNQWFIPQSFNVFSGTFPLCVPACGSASKHNNLCTRLEIIARDLCDQCNNSCNL